MEICCWFFFVFFRKYFFLRENVKESVFSLAKQDDVSEGGTRRRVSCRGFYSFSAIQDRTAHVVILSHWEFPSRSQGSQSTSQLPRSISVDLPRQDKGDAGGHPV